jgi:hypothetical protein
MNYVTCSGSCFHLDIWPVDKICGFHPIIRIVFTNTVAQFRFVCGRGWLCGLKLTSRSRLPLSNDHRSIIPWAVLGDGPASVAS